MKQRRRAQRQSRRVRFDVLTQAPSKNGKANRLHSSPRLLSFDVLPSDAPFLHHMVSLRILFFTYTVFWFPIFLAFDKRWDLCIRWVCHKDRGETAAWLERWWNVRWWHLGDIIPDVFFVIDMIICFRTGCVTSASWRCRKLATALRWLLAMPMISSLQCCSPMLARFIDSNGQMEMALGPIRRRYARLSDIFDYRRHGSSFWLDLLALAPLHIAYLTHCNMHTCHVLALPRLIRVQVSFH